MRITLQTILALLVGIIMFACKNSPVEPVNDFTALPQLEGITKAHVYYSGEEYKYLKTDDEFKVSVKDSVLTLKRDLADETYEIRITLNTSTYEPVIILLLKEKPYKGDCKDLNLVNVSKYEFNISGMKLIKEGTNYKYVWQNSELLKSSVLSEFYVDEVMCKKTMLRFNDYTKPLPTLAITLKK